MISEQERPTGAVRWVNRFLVLPKPSQNVTSFDVRSQSHSALLWLAYYSAAKGGCAERLAWLTPEQGTAMVQIKQNDTTLDPFFAPKCFEYVASRAPDNTTLVVDPFLAGSYRLCSRVHLSPAPDFDIGPFDPLLTERDLLGSVHTSWLAVSRLQHGYYRWQDDLNWIDGSTDDPKRVKEFCRLHDLAETLRKAISLAATTFPDVQHLRMGIREDPENGAEWLTLRLLSKCSPDDARKAYEQFIASWVASVPRFKRGLIRLSYGVG